MSARTRTLEKHAKNRFISGAARTGIVKIVDEKGGGVPLKEAKAIAETQDPLSALEYIAGQQTGIFLLCDFAPYVAPLRTGRPGSGQAVYEKSRGN
jgi:hypothetical protein